MLAPALGRHRGDGAFDELEQRLLDALAGHVAGDRGVVGLARDLVDLVDVDDALLRPFDVVFALLQELLDDVLDVLAHVASLGEGGRVGDGEGHVEQARQGLGEQRLAAAGGADQQNVGLRELDVVLLALVVQPLVVVVHGDREHLLGALLVDDVLVEDALDLHRHGQLVVLLALRARLHLLADDVVAELDALVADVDAGAGDELAHLVLALVTERAVQEAVALSLVVGHETSCVFAAPSAKDDGNASVLQPLCRACLVFACTTLEAPAVTSRHAAAFADASRGTAVIDCRHEDASPQSQGEHRQWPPPSPHRTRTTLGARRRLASTAGRAPLGPTTPASSSWSPRTAMCRSRRISGERAWTSASASACRASPWTPRAANSRRPRASARCASAASSSKARTACATALARRRNSGLRTSKRTAWTPRCCSRTRG